MKNKILVISIMILAGVAGFSLQRAFIDDKNQNLTPELPESTASIVGQQRPDFGLKDIEGQMRKISEWDGKVLLVNFWATWCPPCKKEIPAFMELQNEYGDQGFQVIGIAIDEEEAVKDYADTMGINYPVMAAELAAMEVSRWYGNRLNALPYSAFVGRDGIVSLTKPGELTRQQVEDIIKPMLAMKIAETIQ
ncbi:MAG: TlpA family protein disulfide reductase [Gammaproteobacteria bacterium]|nr:TlpA family protein disulfide reductase [Gammaproteobacteria bacterium]MCW8910167.1 TlpA family protein disulfide reductase [Gammaproteobacteria bacterium]MCW9004351.1 TlpA family protein disulfide reductase [Gammaproteobacteria bacterium]MCW9055454.1 TlpA family protein disulfide reductase [Gammaproteobacteria bacterium]